MRLIFLLILIFALAPDRTQAEIADLYQSSIAVENQSQQAREEAFAPALAQVLGKLSGIRDLDQDPEVVAATSNARSLVVSYFYEQISTQDLSEPRLPGNSLEQESGTLLSVQFSQSGVDDLLRTLGLPRWPPGRAPLSVWLLIDDGLGRQVLPLEYEYLRDPVDRIAQTRGLSLVWPEPDEAGNYNVDVQLLWGGYTEQLRDEGGSGEILIVTARREGPEWNARLILEYEQENWTWRSRNIDLQEVLVETMHQVIDEIATVKAIAATEQGQWIHEISVGGLGSGADYARCLAYLESLSIVDEVAVLAATPRGVSMALVLNAAPEYLQQALEDDRVLESEDGSGQYVLQQ